MATSNPIEPIQPVNIPSAAGINYGEGDVRHFAQGDDMSVPGISNPTRQLAERDNMLAEKLNEVIQNVNNQEQFVPLPVVRTIVPPNDQTVVLNYRIPSGFESRVLNASIGSSPSSTDIELDIYYNAGFGGVTGTAVVTTSTEFTSGVNFYQTGEFIVTLKNKSGVTLEMVASILLTLRPIGSQGSLLVGSTVKGEKGDPGQVGPPGPAGAPGSGGVGSPGMKWSGSWSDSTVYNPPDVVRYDLGGVGVQVSSFICTTAHASSDKTKAPGGYALPGNPWDAVALGGADGATGPTGPAGPSGSTTFTGLERNVLASFYCGTPFVKGAYWQVDDPTTSVYNVGTLASPGDRADIPMKEIYWQAVGAPSPSGMVHLSMSMRACFGGYGTLHLPTVAGGAKLNYSNVYVHAIVTSNGTQPSDATRAWGVVCKPHPSDTNKYVIATIDPTPTTPSPVPMLIEVIGMNLTT